MISSLSLKNVEGKIIECWLVNEEGIFSLRVTVYLRVGNFLQIWILGSKWWSKNNL